MGIIFSIILLLLLIALFPSWPYSARWGYGPSGVAGVLLLVLVVLMLLAIIPPWFTTAPPPP